LGNSAELSVLSGFPEQLDVSKLLREKTAPKDAFVVFDSESNSLLTISGILTSAGGKENFIPATYDKIVLRLGGLAK